MRWIVWMLDRVGAERRSDSPKKSVQATLYSRRGCHLCDEALEVLRAHGLEPQVVDIDQDEQLRERFDTCVPVVVIDGVVRFRGRVNPVLLRRLLRRKRQ